MCDHNVSRYVFRLVIVFRMRNFNKVYAHAVKLILYMGNSVNRIRHTYMLTTSGT